MFSWVSNFFRKNDDRVPSVRPLGPPPPLPPSRWPPASAPDAPPLLPERRIPPAPPRGYINWKDVPHEKKYPLFKWQRENKDWLEK